MLSAAGVESCTLYFRTKTINTFLNGIMGPKGYPIVSAILSVACICLYVYVYYMYMYMYILQNATHDIESIFIQNLVLYFFSKCDASEMFNIPIDEKNKFIPGI